MFPLLLFDPIICLAPLLVFDPPLAFGRGKNKHVWFDLATLPFSLHSGGKRPLPLDPKDVA